MEFADSRLIVSYTDNDIQRLISTNEETAHRQTYTRHFSQGEDFFIHLETPLRIPSLPIHHDFKNPVPAKEYLVSIKTIITDLNSSAPGITDGLTYFFDPRDHLRVSFFKLYRVAEQTYLYQLKIDLVFHPSRHRIIVPGTNDRSPEYETGDLVMEADFIPIESMAAGPKGTREFTISQSISETWIGETGRGYFVQGIWLDRELSKFFSRLFMPEGKRLYPYTPFTCKYRAVCHSAAFLDIHGRKRFLPVIHHGRSFLIRHMQEIEDALRNDEFNERMETFVELRNQVPEQWRSAFSNLATRVYLNDKEMREYELYDEST